MSTSFGKTLRKIQQIAQHTKLQVPVQAVYNQYLQYIDEEYVGSHPNYDYIDLGFFERGDEEYFMILSRWYNGTVAGDSLVIGLDKSGLGYVNWNITNFIDSKMETIVEEGEIKMPNFSGDGRLFKIYPVVKDGGTLVASDTIKTNETLLSDMIIETGVNLIIKDANIYTITDTVTLKGTGFITGTGYISFDEDGWIDINSWNYSVFKGRKDEHPKVIWVHTQALVL